MTIDTAFTRFPSLTTNRLLLRQIQPTDAEAIFETFSDQESHIDQLDILEPTIS